MAGPSLTLIGTGHVFQVRQAVEDAILALRPDIVFVELDRGRLQALLHRERHGAMPQRGGGFVQRRLQRFQEDVAGLYGSQVGEEMVAAVRGAQAAGAQVALIDPPAEETVRRALKALSWRERLRAAGQFVKGGFQAFVARSSESRRGRMDDEIRKYQTDPDAMLEELRRQYPTVHRIVIQERDEVMARRIREGLRDDRRAVAVVGDGHVPGMLRALTGIDTTVYRLADVREGRLPVPDGRIAEGDASDVSFGFDVEV